MSGQCGCLLYRGTVLAIVRHCCSPVIERVPSSRPTSYLPHLLNMFPAHNYPWGGMPYAHPIHQSPGFPYNMGAIPEVVPGTTKGGHAAMMTQDSIRSSVPQQMSHPGMPMHMHSPSVPVPIHPLGYDPLMMMMMGHPMMSPYGMHPGMMAAMMASGGESVEAANEPLAPPSPQVSNSKSARKNQGVRFNPEHMATPVPGHTPPHLAPTRGESQKLSK